MINLDHEIIKMFRQLQHFLKGSKSYILVALLWGHAIEALIVRPCHQALAIIDQHH